MKKFFILFSIIAFFISFTFNSTAYASNTNTEPNNYLYIGTYQGMIDSKSIEMKMNDTKIAFRLSEAIQNDFEKHYIKENSILIIKTYINKYDQFVIYEIQKLVQ